MIGRRALLRALFFLGPVTVLVAACKHRSPYGQKEEPESKGSGY